MEDAAILIHAHDLSALGRADGDAQWILRARPRPCELDARQGLGQEVRVEDLSLLHAKLAREFSERAPIGRREPARHAARDQLACRARERLAQEPRWRLGQRRAHELRVEGEGSSSARLGGALAKLPGARLDIPSEVQVAKVACCGRDAAWLGARLGEDASDERRLVGHGPGHCLVFIGHARAPA